MEGKKTLEAQRTPFRRGVQRGKAATGRFCVAKSPFPLQTSLISPNFPARQPPGWYEKISCVFGTAVAVQGSFWDLAGGAKALQSAASRTIGGEVRLMGYAPYRGAIRRERPAFQPTFPLITNLNHFYPVAERGGSRANPARRDWSRSSRK